MAKIISTFVIEDHMLDSHLCQICYPLEIKILLIIIIINYSRYYYYYASDSTIELSVLTLKTIKLHFLANSSVDHGFGHKTLKTVDCQ